MAIKDHLQTALEKIKAEKEVGINAAKVRITQEKIVPYNAKVDELTNNAIAALDKNRNEKIAEIQSDFEKERGKIVEKAELNKRVNAETVIARETEEIANQYDKTIATITNQILALGE